MDRLMLDDRTKLVGIEVVGLVLEPSFLAFLAYQQTFDSLEMVV